MARAQSGLAQVLEAEKHYDEALELAQQALQIQERLGDLRVEFSQKLVARLQQRVGG